MSSNSSGSPTALYLSSGPSPPITLALTSIFFAPQALMQPHTPCFSHWPSLCSSSFAWLRPKTVDYFGNCSSARPSHPNNCCEQARHRTPIHLNNIIFSLQWNIIDWHAVKIADKIPFQSHQRIWIPAYNETFKHFSRQQMVMSAVRVRDLVHFYEPAIEHLMIAYLACKRHGVYCVIMGSDWSCRKTKFNWSSPTVPENTQPKHKNEINDQVHISLWTCWSKITVLERYHDESLLKFYFHLIALSTLSLFSYLCFHWLLFLLFLVFLERSKEAPTFWRATVFSRSHHHFLFWESLYLNFSLCWQQCRTWWTSRNVKSAGLRVCG